jgi:hypothetical protein
MDGSRLSLKSERLRVLAADDLKEIAGGGPGKPCENSCLFTPAL